MVSRYDQVIAEFQNQDQETEEPGLLELGRRGLEAGYHQLSAAGYGMMGASVPWGNRPSASGRDCVIGLWRATAHRWSRRRKRPVTSSPTYFK